MSTDNDLAKDVVLSPQDLPSPDVLADIFKEYGFDGARYKDIHADLQGMDVPSATMHFAAHGLHEGRSPGFTLSAPQIQSLRANEWAHSWGQLLARCILASTVNHVRNLPPSHTPGPLMDLLGGGVDYMPALIIGDSHSAFLHDANTMLKGGILPAPMLCLAGSARGLSNPDSRGGHRRLIFNRLATFGRALTHRPIVFQFGQVDIEFVFDMKRIRDGVTAYDPAQHRSFIEETVEKYTLFLRECRTRSAGRIIVMSALPPVLDDATVRDGYTHAHIAELNDRHDVTTLRDQLRSLDYPDMLERTEQSRYFNRLMESACADMGIAYIEEFDSLLGPDGTVRREFTTEQDHHLFLNPAPVKDRILACARKINAIAMA
jgi:hypothetical protein